MPYGYGLVAASTFAGFILGAIIEHGQTVGGNNLIQILGFLSLATGLVFMITRRQAITGTLGGLLFGFGLGVNFSSVFWPSPSGVLPLSLF